MRQDTATRSRRLAAIALLAILAGGSGTLLATGNIGFLRDAPMTRFKGADLEMFQANLAEALEKDADGGVRRWENAKSGSSGEIAIVKSFTYDNKPCRNTRITNRARGYAEATTRSVFCKDAKGRWRTDTKAKPAASGSRTPAGK
jgi:surface antigen